MAPCRVILVCGLLKHLKSHKNEGEEKEMKLTRVTILAGVGCGTVLTYVKSEWPEMPHEIFIPPGRVEKVNWFGAFPNTIHYTNNDGCECIFIDYIRTDKDGNWTTKRPSQTE